MTLKFHRIIKDVILYLEIMGGFCDYEVEVVKARFKFKGSKKIYIKSLTKTQCQNLKQVAIIEFCEII